MYTCKSCGAEIAADMKFCGTCGAPVERPEAPPGSMPAAGKTGAGKLKKLIVPVMILAVVMIAASVVFNAFKPSKYETVKGVIFIWQDDDEVVIEPSGESKTKIDGVLVSQLRSFDGTKAALLINEDGTGSSYNSDGYTLYHVSDKVNRITDGVYDAKLSLSGDGIAFTKEVDYSANEGELYLWINGNVNEITSPLIGAHFAANIGYCISPDGRTVAFTYVGLDGEDIIGAYPYYSTKLNGAVHGDDVQLVAIADDAKYVYYNKNSAFYVMKGSDDNSKQKLGENVYQYYFNSDLSQIVYTSDEKSYISRNGGEKQSLSGSVGYFLMPRGTSQHDYVIGISSFADTFFHSGGNSAGITRINAKFEASSVARDRNINGAVLADDGRTIIYSKSGGLYKIDGLKENADTVELVDGDVDGFIVTKDGSTIYFNSYNEAAPSELYYQKGTGKPIVIDASFSSFSYGPLAIFKEDILYYVDNFELYVFTGAKGKLVSEFDDKVIGVSAGLYSIIVRTTDGSKEFSYHSTDGKTWELEATYPAY
ncbi:MAG: zinc ribbon domain-containing protein [Oscillospiraceae bacterium]|jgi:hypothetical protein|nr:zinc ribbon domain-containing protein [Oscillospiraceae bacterium]